MKVYKLGAGDPVRNIPGAPRILRPGETFTSEISLDELAISPRVKARLSEVDPNQPAGQPRTEPAAAPPDRGRPAIEGELYEALARRLDMDPNASPMAVVQRLGMRLSALEALEARLNGAPSAAAPPASEAAPASLVSAGSQPAVAELPLPAVAEPPDRYTEAQLKAMTVAVLDAVAEGFGLELTAADRTNKATRIEALRAAGRVNG